VEVEGAVLEAGADVVEESVITLGQMTQISKSMGGHQSSSR
jgi:hypothetical protein